ncbi:MAG: type II toxin-antitoxin system RelE/ParE family toxin [Burkholderiaceae bacterium]|nr:type II toxin-antitoxin system RelE/ParE family toxin [Burkholderiaceae bacterium]
MPARYRVLLTQGAEQDLESIHEYIAEFDSPENADRVLDRLATVTEQLGSMPDRGSYPKELLALGIKEYRQVFFKPYRVIYRVIGADVVVFLIADGRRDMQSLLARRLLGA